MMRWCIGNTTNPSTDRGFRGLWDFADDLLLESVILKV
jgi:hypothetical protein